MLKCACKLWSKLNNLSFLGISASNHYGTVKVYLSEIVSASVQLSNIFFLRNLLVTK